MSGTVFFFVRFDREDDVHEHEDGEQQSLDEPDQELEPDEGECERGDDEERRHHGDRDLAAEDVAPETERQREHAEELGEELDRADDDHDRAHHELHRAGLTEPAEVEEAAEVAEAVLADALPLVDDERGHRKTRIDVVVGRRRAERLDVTAVEVERLADERHQTEVVREQDEEEDRPEERHVAKALLTSDPLDEVRETLHHQLHEVLPGARLLAQVTREQERADDEDRDDDPHREERVRDRDLVAHDADERLAGEIRQLEIEELRRKRSGDGGDRERDDVHRRRDDEDASHSSSPASRRRSRSSISRSHRRPASLASSLTGGTGLSTQ